MIVYWAYPQSGAGHAVRAAAVCRWLDSEFVVIRGTDRPEINRALDHFEIPYIVEENRRKAEDLVREMKPKTLVMDDRANGRLEEFVNLYIWRLGRPNRSNRGKRMIKIEGPGSTFPIVMLELSEILGREEAREDLGLPQDGFIKAGVASVDRPGVVEAHKPDTMISNWPALRWMAAADHIVGCIGANLYGEVAYMGLPATWIRAPQVKDQAPRMWDLPQAPVLPDAAKRIAKVIEDIHAKA